ncbi:MAG: 3,4-dihydroxy-2-butanone-4-phosphate synthase [Proteobacteria bacterium]|nr:3,4-dihydroxy-2-butanone-4-phosphate synthase [Pseudomonadota bacterium]
MSGLSTITEAIEHVRAGNLVIVVDNEDRENEGDLIMAAEKADQQKIAFMIRYTSGIICAPCEASRLDDLELPQMVDKNSDPLHTQFTVSVDYISGMTTGVSALERSRTLNALANNNVTSGDFARPGHVFPLRYRKGGVLVRSGHTEAAVDLCRLAGLTPAGVLSELNHDDGTMMRLPALKEFAATHSLPIISIDELINYRARNEVLINEVVATPIRINGFDLTAHVYKTVFDDKYITAVVRGTIDGSKPTLVRVVKGAHNRDFLTSALAGDNVIHRSLQMIGGAEQGVFIYLPADDDREAPADEQTGAVWREVGLGSHILSSLGVERIHLLASHEFSYPGIASFGLTIETIIKED